MSIGAFWALWTDLLNREELEPFVAHLKDKETFYRHHPIPSMPANHERYQPDGRYWQGGVWAPTNYTMLSGLKNKGFDSLAFELAMKHHEQVSEVFKKTGTLWEYYSPESTNPGLLARPDFVGWTGLVPVAVLFEIIFGLKANELRGTLKWDVRLTDEHGVDRYPVGRDGLLSLKCLARKSVTEKPRVEISSNSNLRLLLSWEGGHRSWISGRGTIRSEKAVSRSNTDHSALHSGKPLPERGCIYFIISV